MIVPGRTSVVGGVTLGPVGLVTASADGDGVDRPTPGPPGAQAPSENPSIAHSAAPRMRAALLPPPPRPSRVIVLTKIRDQFYDQRPVQNRSPSVTPQTLASALALSRAFGRQWAR